MTQAIIRSSSDLISLETKSRLPRSVPLPAGWLARFHPLHLANFSTLTILKQRASCAKRRNFCKRANWIIYTFAAEAEIDDEGIERDSEEIDDEKFLDTKELDHVLEVSVQFCVDRRFARFGSVESRERGLLLNSPREFRCHSAWKLKNLYLPETRTQSYET